MRSTVDDTQPKGEADFTVPGKKNNPIQVAFGFVLLWCMAVMACVGLQLTWVASTWVLDLLKGWVG